MSAETTPLIREQTLGRLVKVSGDLALPGFSQYLDRNYESGLFHTILGAAAGVVAGPIGYLLVGADSISRTQSGRGLLSHVTGVFTKDRTEEDDQDDDTAPRSRTLKAKKSSTT